MSPFRGTGKPEPLKRELSGCWSRRIDEQHRLVYEVHENKIRVLAAQRHISAAPLRGVHFSDGLAPPDLNPVRGQFRLREHESILSVCRYSSGVLYATRECLPHVLEYVICRSTAPITSASVSDSITSEWFSALKRLQNDPSPESCLWLHFPREEMTTPSSTESSSGGSGRSLRYP
ncbi:MAG: Txe/YoeB family addiction module toxin [Gemmatimonadetes bacterium]|nr:Txe/YoeB family addiction module toxin [Gemmatimonadota bacterium]